MAEIEHKPSALLVDLLATDQGHLIADDLLITQALLPLVGNLEVVSSPFSAANIARRLQIPTHAFRMFGSLRRFVRLQLILRVLGLDCSGRSDVIFQSYEEVFALFFLLLHPGKRAHFIATNNISCERMGRHPLLWRLLTKAILKRAATLFVHSQFEVDTLRRVAGPPDCAKIRIIPFHQIASDRPQRSWAQRNRTILFMGPVLSRKPVEPLIHLIKADEKRSFRYLLRRMDNIDSDARVFLESQPNVDIGYGYLKDEEYYRLFSESVLVILTHNRLFEGELSGLFCDAIASGTPIIALDMSPHNEFFSRFGEMGFLADYASDPEWHKRILASGLEALYDGFQQNMAKCRESCGIEPIRKVLRSAIMQKT